MRLVWWLLVLGLWLGFVDDRDNALTFGEEWSGLLCAVVVCFLFGFYLLGGKSIQ